MSDRKRASSSLRTSERSRASKAPAFRSTPSQAPSERSRLLHRQQDANTHNDAVGEIVANRAAPSQTDPSQTDPSQQSLPETAVGSEATGSETAGGPEVAAGSEAATSEVDVDPETAAPEAIVGPEATSPETDVALPLDYQPIDSSIASRFEQCTGENVSGVLIAENPDLLAQGKRGVAIEGRCIEVIPGCLQDLALCAHELTHIFQQRGPLDCSKQKNNDNYNQTGVEIEAKKSEYLLKNNRKFKITLISLDKKLYDNSENKGNQSNHVDCAVGMAPYPEDDSEPNNSLNYVISHLQQMKNKGVSDEDIIVYFLNFFGDNATHRADEKVGSSIRGRVGTYCYPSAVYLKCILDQVGILSEISHGPINKSHYTILFPSIKKGLIHADDPYIFREVIDPDYRRHGFIRFYNQRV